MTTYTGTQLVDKLIDLADLIDMEVRHPRPTLLGYINASLSAVRAELTRGGFTGLLDWSAPAALPTTPPVTGQNYLEVAWPAGAVSIHGVDVNYGTSGAGARWDMLDTMVLAERRRWYANQGPPRAFLVRSVPKETSPSSVALDTNTGKIQIYPASTLGLEYQVIYLAQFPPLSAEAHVVSGFDEDWIQWALWNATILALFKDDEMDPSQDQKAVREREIIGQRMLTNAIRLNRAGPIQPVRAGGIRFKR